MDQDDPEKRIAELERQLAEPRATGANREAGRTPFGSAATTPGCLTPEQVRNVGFSKPRIGRRGYDGDEVDAFLEVVAAALGDPAGCTLTPEHVHRIAFSKPRRRRRGYNEDEVDAFLDLIEQQLKSR